MLRLFKVFLCLGLLAGGFQSAWGFALLGPINEAYQTQEIGYNLPGDIGAPKNLGEEYRKNIPVIYYAFDANFLDYFGSNGMHEVDAALGVFNSLQNVSSYSPELSEFPFNTQRRNARAEALSMIDLKSLTMQLMMEQLGVAEATRYTWTLHDRYLLPNTTCPAGEVYLIIKRNFDPGYGTVLDQLKPTSYVNGVLYSYQIAENCGAAIPNAVTVPFSVDPVTEAGQPVSELYGFGNSFTLNPYGGFYSGLTRDDVGGLRYLLRANNFNFENIAPGAYSFDTNPVPQLLISSNLTLLAAQALTNSAAALQTLYPGLVILSTSNFFVNVNLTNTTFYFTNYPWDPAFTAPHLILLTNITPTVLSEYAHTFGNVLRIVPNGHGGWSLVPMTTIPAPNGWTYETIETTSVALSNNPWAPAGGTFVTTNVTDSSFAVPNVVGDYVILPAGWCDAAILNSQLTNVVTVTNAIASATNILVISTNSLGFTNAGTILAYNQNEITYFTNHTFVALPIICNTNSVALRGGMEKITFIRRDFDSLLSRFFFPITNDYVVNVLTNFAVMPQRVQRVITAPDLLFSAQDLTAGPNGPPAVLVAARNDNFVPAPAGAYPGLAGPGTLDGPTAIIFNKVGPIFYNGGLAGLADTNAFVDELSQQAVWAWGSFDGTTNTPVVYPSDLSIQNLENQALIQISPPGLPDTFVDDSYSAQLYVLASTSNWQLPSTWSVAPGSPGLPPGLGINTAADGSALISGSPTMAGFYDFILRITDAQGRTLDRSFSIRVRPPL